MHKLLLIILSAIATGIVSAQQNTFSISGKIDANPGNYIYLSYQNINGKSVRDSALIDEGKFSFEGNLSGPASATLMMDRKGRSFDKYAQLFLTPGKMKLSVLYNNFSDGVVLKGFSVQDEWDKLKKEKAEVMAKLKPFSEAYNEANNIYIEAMREKKDEATLESLKGEATKAKDAMDPFYDQ